MRIGSSHSAVIAKTAHNRQPQANLTLRTKIRGNADKIGAKGTIRRSESHATAFYRGLAGCDPKSSFTNDSRVCCFCLAQLRASS
jgi:hypothetical protein